MMPLISIVVPVFNVERHLSACLDALRAQTLAEVEIICVDDASSDASASILHSAANLDSRIVVLRHASNRGLPSARNTGLQAARSAWVLHVDSDDLVSSHLCARTLAAANRYGADAVFFGYAVFTDGEPAPAEPMAATPELADRRDLLRRPAFAWTKLVRTELMRARDIRFPEGLCIEDAPVHWRLALESEQPVVLDEALVWYRQRGGSITYRTDWSRADGILAFDIVGNYLRSTGRWEEWKGIFLVQQLESFASTHAYYALANPKLTARVRDEARARMTLEHWGAVLGGEGLPRWERDYFLACCEPPRAVRRAGLLLPVVRHRLRDPLRCLWHRVRLGFGA